MRKDAASASSARLPDPNKGDMNSLTELLRETDGIAEFPFIISHKDIFGNEYEERLILKIYDEDVWMFEHEGPTLIAVVQ